MLSEVIGQPDKGLDLLDHLRGLGAADELYLVLARAYAFLRDGVPEVPHVLSKKFTFVDG